MATSHGMLIYHNDITPDTLVDMKGDRKIVEVVSGQGPNASLFQLDKEDHTLANLLRMKLHESPYVHIAGYRVPHPTQHRVELRVQTASDTGAGNPLGAPSGSTKGAAAAATAVPTPKEALRSAIDECLADLQTFEQQLRAQAQDKGLEVAGDW